MTEKPPRTGLSPSSLATFLGCNRRYYHKKIAKTPIDKDSPEDLESFEVGKFFHKCLEVRRHELSGMTYEEVYDIGKGYRVADLDATAPMIFAMLTSYKSMHEKSGLKAIHCEIEVETANFFGIVDVILQAEDGSFWIGDMKTAARFDQMIVPSLPRHPQLNLYAVHYPEIAQDLGLDPAKFRGCRYRLTTKSKAGRKAGETVQSFSARLPVKSYDFILPLGLLDPLGMYRIHHDVYNHIQSNSLEKLLDPESGVTVDKAYPQNFANCLSYFRPCEFFSQCYGKEYTAELGISCIVSDEG